MRDILTLSREAGSSTDRENPRDRYGDVERNKKGFRAVVSALMGEHEQAVGLLATIVIIYSAA